MKKILSFILILALAISCVSMITFTASAATYGQLTYTVSNGKVTITDCSTSASGALTIPSTISGYPVTSIGSSAFYNCSRLTSITIPDSVTSIDSNAFCYCSRLTNITIPDSVTSIGYSAFSSCSSLISITIPDSVTSIDDSAFRDCSSLTSITIPDSVTSIGYRAFENCSSLTSITVDENNEKYYSQGNCIITKDTNTLVVGCKNSVIPDSVTSIGSLAFRGCSSLTRITIPDSVTSIGSYAFYNCRNLTSITIPDSVTSIGGDAFCNCSSLTSITIPDSVTSIGSAAFSYCSSLTSITIPDSVTSIGDYAFYNCDSLTSITIGDSVTSIGSCTFYNCSKLNSVYYRGTQAQWNSISIGSDNSYLTNATRYYNSCIGSAEHTYDNACDKACNECENTRTVPDHIYDNACDVNCNVCGNVRTITHTYDNACDSVCNVCENTRTVPAHVYDNACDKACNECGNTRTVPDHVYDNACDVNCNVCGNVRTVPDHVYDNDCDTDCNECENTRTVPDHVYDNDCDAACNECGNTRTVPDHIYDNACDAACNECGNTRTVPAHVYDNACDVNCNVCGNIRTVPDHSYTLNDNHTCDICKYSKTPSNPVVESKTNSSVTLVKLEGFEYSKDGVNWQVSNVFNNLLPDTTYTFYQRVKASSIANVSEISEGTAVTFKSAQSAPSEPVIFNFTDTVITLRPIQNGEYSIDGILWQDSNVFNNLLPGTTYIFYQRYKETDSFEASNISSTSFATEKAEQILIPNAPTLAKCTATSITLNAVEGCEYSINGTTWQTSTTFTGLSCGTEYTFYQRYKENETYYVGKKSSGATFKTDKGTQSAPSAPTLLSKTHNTVTLNKVDGYEYSFDGITWQTSNVFTNLEPKTNYMFYQRKAETNKYYASASSTYLIVKTNEEPQFIYGDVNGDGLINKKDDLALRMYLANLTVEIDLEAADVFVDGTVNKKDLLLLKQYLAGWSVQLGK